MGCVESLECVLHCDEYFLNLVEFADGHVVLDQDLDVDEQDDDEEDDEEGGGECGEGRGEFHLDDPKQEGNEEDGEVALNDGEESKVAKTVSVECFIFIESPMFGFLLVICPVEDEFVYTLILCI